MLADRTLALRNIAKTPAALGRSDLPCSLLETLRSPQLRPRAGGASGWEPTEGADLHSLASARQGERGAPLVADQLGSPW